VQRRRLSQRRTARQREQGCQRHARHSKVLREGAGVTLIGLAIGIVVAWWTGRLVAG
jgi:hypothetical protein